MFEKGDRVIIKYNGGKPSYDRAMFKQGTITQVRTYDRYDTVYYVELDCGMINENNGMNSWCCTEQMLMKHKETKDFTVVRTRWTTDDIKNIIKENKMEILEIYYERKLSKLLDNKNEELAKAQKKDENYVKIQNLADELAKLSKVTTMTFGIQYNNYEYCDEVKSLFEKIENKYNQKTRELVVLRQEVEAQLLMCETYEQKQNVLRNYEIIDEKGKINA